MTGLAAVGPAEGGSPAPGEARVTELYVGTSIWARYLKDTNYFEIAAHECRTIDISRWGPGGYAGSDMFYNESPPLTERIVNGPAWQDVDLLRTNDGKIEAKYELTGVKDDGSKVKTGYLQAPVFWYEAADAPEHRAPGLVLRFDAPSTERTSPLVMQVRGLQRPRHNSVLRHVWDKLVRIQ